MDNDSLNDTITSMTAIVGLLDSETVDMCRRKNLLHYVPVIYDIIFNTYYGVDDIIFKRLEDYETPECEKLHCKIHLRSLPDQILNDEDVFYGKFFDSIPEDKQHLFVITYKVVK